ncbi:MAG: NAD-binding protein [Candidatus Levybacteria bacterium]|nr:NAD-binding protein [Candidatus Levybacteria bacterium]
MIRLRGKKVAVVGVGVEGISSVKWLREQGAKVTGFDKNPKILSNEVIKKLRSEGVQFKTGKNYLNKLSGFDLIIRSPGVKISQLPITNYQLLSSQTKLFFDLCPCPIIGVTGTKGKGTTSALIYEMLKKEGPPAGGDAYLGGNIGQPPLEFLDKLSVRPASPQGESIVVLELSSFQLQDMTKSPHIVVMLMTTSEHLDYHKDVYEYVEVKRNLLRFQTESDFAILNKDYPASRESDAETKGKVFWVSREGEVDEGCFVRGKKIVLRAGRLPHVANDVQQTQKKNSGQTPSLSERQHQGLKEKLSQSASAFSSFASGQAPISEEEIISVDEILLPGAHNLENVCAAVMAAFLAGVSKQNIVSVLKTFKGLEHRLELVREVGGVRYYDDSFSTTPETAIAAIQAFKNPEILILGGSSKNSDFTELGRVISEAKNIKAIIGIGKEWKRIKERIKNHESRIMVAEGTKNMQQIVQAASKVAQPGDVVILSPACASFDMFKNYKDRGEQFKKEVNKLKS